MNRLKTIVVCLLLSLCANTSIRAQFAYSELMGTNNVMPDVNEPYTGFGVPVQGSGQIIFSAVAGPHNGVCRVSPHEKLPSITGGLPGPDLRLDGSKLLVAGGSGCYSVSGTTVTTLVDNTQLMPPWNTNNFDIFFGIRPYGGGQLVWGRNYFGTTEGLYQTPGATPVIVTGDPIPGPGVSTYSFGNVLDFDSDGSTTVVIAQARPPNHAYNGMYRLAGGSPTKILDTTTIAPPSGFVFTGLGKAKVSGTNIFFTAGSTVWGIYRTTPDGSVIEHLVSNATTIPGTTNKFAVGDGFDYDNGVLVFEASDALYLMVGTNFSRIIGAGDSLSGKTINYVLMSRQSLSGGTLVFHAFFTDSSSAIYRTTVGTGPGVTALLVPESMIFSSLSGFSFTFVGHRSGATYRIEYTTSLVPFGAVWNTLTHVTNTGPVTITDPTLTGLGRLYRAVWVGP